jgi:hypothetical protein
MDIEFLIVIMFMLPVTYLPPFSCRLCLSVAHHFGSILLCCVADFVEGSSSYSGIIAIVLVIVIGLGIIGCWYKRRAAKVCLHTQHN